MPQGNGSDNWLQKIITDTAETAAETARAARQEIDRLRGDSAEEGLEPVLRRRRTRRQAPRTSMPTLK